MAAARQILMTLAVLTAPAWAADPKLPQTVGANEIMKLTAPAGFVDDVVTWDAQRVAYVIADTASKAELHIVQLGCAKCAENKQEIVVDLAPITLHPASVKLVGATRAFVVGSGADGTSQVAAMIDLGTKKTLYKVGPASHIVVRDGVFAHFSKGDTHWIEKYALDSGKRLMKSKPLEVANGYEKRIGLKVNHWDEGWTRAVGLKDGAWVKKENQRSPDTEAVYDLKLGRYVDDKPITDLFEQRKRFAVLAEASQSDFVRMTPDNQSIQLWHAGAAKTVELDQPIASYDPKSLQGVINADGTAWLALQIDPVNGDAVVRKKADPEYLDVFKVGIDGKAVRKARVLGKAVKFRFGVVGDLFWLLERSPGFDRGGRGLTIYSLAS